MAQQPSPPAAPPQQPPPPPPKPDPEAVKLFNRAQELYGRQREGWLKTTLWQQVDVQGLTFRSEGLYLSGPNQRLRLDLNVRVGNTDGELQIISNGATLWQIVRIGTAERVVTKYDLKKVLEVLNKPNTQQARDEFFRDQSFSGVAPLLQNLQQQLVFTRQEPGQWKGRKAHVLTGVWSADVTTNVLRSFGGPDRWPSTLARKCVLYLDEQNLWPLRLEWRGGPPKGEDQVLLQMEFRDPQFLAADAPAPADYEGKFAFDERNLKVIDQTTKIVEDWQARARQFASQNKPGLPGQPAPPMSR
jgi:hypothetical protein